MRARVPSWLPSCALLLLVATTSCRSRPAGVPLSDNVGQTPFDVPLRPEPLAAIFDPIAAREAEAREEEAFAVTLVGVHIEPTIMNACGLPRPRAFFELDSAALHPAAAPLLDALATCLLGGPLRGRELVLVGHADPRGPSTYNWALGLERGKSVREALVARGLADGRVEVLSRGEDGATGWDPLGYQFDRRVEVFLAR